MEFENNIPIYIQVINQIKKDIITGKLPMGAKLPSTRELAVLYHINPNTAGRVYKEMELQNMCYTKRGLGTFVTEDAAVFKSMREEMAQEFINDLFSTLRERMLDLQYCKVVFVGGGAILLKRQIETSGKVGTPFFVPKINANADGYEYLYRIETAGR